MKTLLQKGLASGMAILAERYLGALGEHFLAQGSFGKNICHELSPHEVHHSRGRYWANVNQWDLVGLLTALFGEERFLVIRKRYLNT